MLMLGCFSNSIHLSVRNSLYKVIIIDTSVLYVLAIFILQK